jgi:hypothetical protein
MNRAARLEAGTFTTCLNDVLNLRERPLMEMDPEMYGGGEPGREQVKNYLLAEGFRRSVGASNVIHLCLRYSAQAERLYRRAVEDFDRIRALGPSIDAWDPPFEPLVDQTNPNPPQPAEPEPLTPSDPAPETPPAARTTPEPSRNPWRPPDGDNTYHYDGCICDLCLADKARLAEKGLTGC